MSGSVGDGVEDSAEGAAKRVAGGVQEVQRAVCGTACGIGEVRATIRAQPITAALIVFGLGYLLGSLIHSRRS